MNSRDELVETILCRTNISDTTELAEAVESCREASGGPGSASLPDDPRLRSPGTFLVFKEIVIYCCVGWIRCPEPDYWPRHRKRLGFGSMFCRFRLFRHYWTLTALGLPLPSQWELMFVFPILVAAAAGWTVGVSMACSANTALATSQGIRQWMAWLRERFKNPACHRFWSLLG